jgi:hypothetical protein
MPATQHGPAGPPPWSIRNPVFWVGVFILLCFVVVFAYLVSVSGKTDPQWSHLAYLYGGLEAIAFTVVGAFFGSTVQRGRVEDAKAQATAAQVREDGVRVAGELGDGLLTLVQMRAQAKGINVRQPFADIEGGDDGEFEDEQIGATAGAGEQEGADNALLRELLAYEQEFRNRKRTNAL